MFLAEKTVKNYVSNLLTKMGMARRTEAAVYAARLEERQRRRPDVKGSGRRRRAWSRAGAVGGEPAPGSYWTTRAVTMPNIPVARSTWFRMWQCQTQVPTSLGLMSTV